MSKSTLIELSKIQANLTDKSDIHHTFAGQSYLHVYERYFESRRNITSLLEIGVLNGCSLRLWRDYFQQAKIWGLDIDPSRSIHSGDRIEVVIGDQSNHECLKNLGDTAGGFDIVIDDGSHITSYIIESLRGLWPHLRSGGIYAIEDLGLSYGPPVPEIWTKFHPGMTYNGDLTLKRHSRNDFEYEMMKLVNTMDGLTGNVRAVHFHPMMVLIEKT